MSKTAYFDNAATTFPKPEDVYVFMDKFYRECGVNVGRGQHKLAYQASKLVEETRQLLLNLLRCPNKKVVFTHTATEALNIILQGIKLKDNYNIYLSPFEHNAVTRTIHYLQSLYKLNLYSLSVDKKNLSYDLEKIKNQFAQNEPHLVIVSHASNVCGVVAPIEEICKLSKNYQAINVIDICQTAGLIDTDLSNENIDFAVFAGHKTLYGPLGVAGFISSGEIKPIPLLFGGTGIDSANLTLPETIPEIYEVASPNILAISGLHALFIIYDESGKLFDFVALKTGHPIITDYSRIDREVIVKDNIIMLGDYKRKIKISSTDELKKTFLSLIRRIYKTQKYMNYLSIILSLIQTTTMIWKVLYALTIIC